MIKRQYLHAPYFEPRSANQQYDLRHVTYAVDFCISILAFITGFAGASYWLLG